jgi:hypothetical protein
MWANTFVACFAPITIHAEYLKTGREIVGDKPTINLLSAAPSKSNHFAPMLCTVIVDVIYCQERWFCFAATGAFVTAICVVTFIFQPLIVSPVCLPMAVKIGKSPFSHALGGNPGVSLFPPLLRCFRLVRIGKLPFAVFLSHLVFVPRFPRVPKVCLACAAHGVETVLGLVEPVFSLGFLKPAFAACFHMASAWLLIFHCYNRI